MEDGVLLILDNYPDTSIASQWLPSEECPNQATL